MTIYTIHLTILSGLLEVEHHNENTKTMYYTFFHLQEWLRLIHWGNFRLKRERSLPSSVFSTFTLLLRCLVKTKLLSPEYSPLRPSDIYIFRLGSTVSRFFVHGVWTFLFFYLIKTLELLEPFLNNGSRKSILGSGWLLNLNWKHQKFSWVCSGSLNTRCLDILSLNHRRSTIYTPVNNVLSFFCV